VSATCHLGYRRNKTGGGSWVARFYDGERYIKHTLGSAADERPPDGASVLNFSEAQDKARTWFAEQARRAAGLEPEDAEPYTVARCLGDYLDWYAAHRKSAATTRYAVEAHILPALGDKEAAMLTTTAIRRWHQGLAAQPARVRSAKGRPPGERSTDRPEHERKRRATANRVLAILKAALNFAYREGRIPSDEAWRRMKPFRGVDAPRIRFLDQDEIARLFNACEPDFRPLVEAALLTGCRYGEIVRSRVSDYSADLQALYIREAKSNRSRHVYLGDCLHRSKVTTGSDPK
jgi:integrase